MKKLVSILLLLVMAAALVHTFREPILQRIGFFLIREDAPRKAEVAFVLSGGAFDRGNEAVKLYRMGLCRRLICTGGNLSKDYESQGDTLYESDLTARHLLRMGVPQSAVKVMQSGSSTEEEVKLIGSWMQAHPKANALVISSDFHTRRIQWTLERLLPEAHRRLAVVGAECTYFNQHRWWENENGMIAVNNEYMKLLYYRLKF